MAWVSRDAIARYTVTAVGGVIILFGALLMLVAFVSGVLFVALGALITPQCREFIAETRGEPLSTIVVGGLAIVLVIGAFAAIPAAVPDDPVPTAAGESASKTERATTQAAVPATATPTAAPAVATTVARPADDPVDATPVITDATVVDPTAVVAERRLSSAEVMQGLSTIIGAQDGVTVRSAYMDGSIGVLEYTSSASSTEQLAYEMSIVAGAYAEAMKHNDEMAGVVVYLYASDGSLAGSYEIQRGWAVAYNSGTMTTTEYVDAVLGTLRAA